MKKSITLLIAMYIYLIVPMGILYLIGSRTDGSGDAYVGLEFAVFAVCLVFLFITGILNIKSAVGLLKGEDYNKLRSEMKRAKLGSIPFFVVEFIILVAMAAGFTLLSIFFFWTIGGPIALMIWLTLSIMIVYAALLMSSAYGIAFTVLLQKEGMINYAALVPLVLLQFIPVADIIVTISLLSKHKERVRETQKIFSN